MTTIDCRVIVDDVRLADTAPDFYAATPTVLADLDVTWGRSTVVDQPEPATARLTVVDRPGGGGFEDVLNVGAAIEVWAKGDISTGGSVDVAVDGGFETLPLGPVDNRVEAASGVSPGDVTITAVDAPVYEGTRAVALDVSTAWNVGPTVWVPPAAFTPDDPAGWDTIPRFSSGQRWVWRLAVRAGRGVLVNLTPVVFDTPTNVPSSAAGTAGPRIETVGDGDWHVYVATTDTSTAAGDAWLGIKLNAFGGTPWRDVAGTWADAVGVWLDYAGTTIDQQILVAPSSGLFRDVLVFAGRITDLGVDAENDGTLRVEVIATDQLAELANRYVGDQPWPTETLEARAQRILSLAAPGATLLVDDGLAGLSVTRRDVDSQPAAGLLGELAAGVDGVLWSAIHATTGAYLWIEDVALRAQLGTLALVGDAVVISVVAGGNRPSGQTVIDGCLLPVEEPRWIRDVSDVVTRVDATWVDQSTTPDVTERSVRVVDTAAETQYGSRRHGVSTPLTSEAAAIDVCQRILARSGEGDWRLTGVVYDLGQFPPDAGAATVDALNLLDGTTRIGRALSFTNLVYGPTGATTAMYLDGGQYRFDGDWSLALATTPMAGMGQSGPWTSLDPTWRWNQFDPAISWLDLFGVSGPITTLEGA